MGSWFIMASVLFESILICSVVTLFLKLVDKSEPNFEWNRLAKCEPNSASPSAPPIDR